MYDVCVRVWVCRNSYWTLYWGSEQFHRFYGNRWCGIDGSREFKCFLSFVQLVVFSTPNVFISGFLMLLTDRATNISTWQKFKELSQHCLQLQWKKCLKSWHVIIWLEINVAFFIFHFLLKILRFYNTTSISICWLWVRKVRSDETVIYYYCCCYYCYCFIVGGGGGVAFF